MSKTEFRPAQGQSSSRRYRSNRFTKIRPSRIAFLAMALLMTACGSEEASDPVNEQSAPTHTHADGTGHENSDDLCRILDEASFALGEAQDDPEFFSSVQQSEQQWIDLWNGQIAYFADLEDLIPTNQSATLEQLLVNLETIRDQPDRNSIVGNEDINATRVLVADIAHPCIE